MTATTTQEHGAVLDLEPIAERLPAAQPAQALTIAQNSPAAMMLAAMAQGASLEQFEKMMDLQERWEAGEARKKFNAAFAAFKAENVKILKGRKVNDGPLRGKSYAELKDWTDAVAPALSLHGLSTKWRISRDEPQWIEVVCELRHVDGHIETAVLGGPPDVGGAKNAIQARASTVSYLERYTLKAVLGLAEGGDDDDGNGNGGNAQEPSQRQPAADGATQILIQAGEAAAGKGMAALTAWWGGLAEVQRKALTPAFKGMRFTAGQIDASQKGAK